MKEESAKRRRGQGRHRRVEHLACLDRLHPEWTRDVCKLELDRNKTDRWLRHACGSDRPTEHLDPVAAAFMLSPGLPGKHYDLSGSGT